MAPHHQQCDQLLPLLDQLQQWKERTKDDITIVTFNYDLLLEDALPTVGINLTADINSYVVQDGWRIIKPHGSVNWAREAEARDQLTDKYHVVDAYSFPGNMFPAIAMPVESVKDFECPNMHMRSLEDALQPGSWQLLVIGWKGTEKNFLEILSRFVPRTSKLVTTIVCGTQAEAATTKNNLASAIDLSHVTLYGAGFTEFVVRKDALKLLV